MTEIAAGEVVVVRDEEWLVRSVRTDARGTTAVEVTGVTELVRDQRAVFYDSLEESIDRLDPRQAKPRFDDTPGFRRSRLWLESILRRSPVPASDTRITTGHLALLHSMDYQLRPAARALQNLRPRVLIGDAVGLGKTLEIGILLSELIRRGRGERILVVTPRAVLEQFQRELWTRFAIPLIRLDSEGIRAVQQELPASRNPFSYHRRVIISIDTLKDPVHYQHHLRQHRWDAVVIDECHNLINRGTQNNRLARVLADRTDALILASATPHNGKPESFAELVNLLDPTAITDPKNYTARDIESLYVRRHRHSADVRHEVEHRWKARATPQIVEVAASAAERAVLAELDATWLHPSGAGVVDHQHRLFPWTLLKAFLSSPQALHATIRRRLDGSSAGPAERAALTTLDELAEAAAPAPSKWAALVEHLQTIGVGPRSPARAVVFTERIDTLQRLVDWLPAALGLPGEAVAALHATLSDKQIQGVVEAFGQDSSPLRVLVASDMASEGLNLHQACHHLVHYDLPWSFIRVQQRNGRIDRYGQERTPRISALALTGDGGFTSELRVVTRLLQKEHEANRALGDAGVLLDLHDAVIEEDTVKEALRTGKDLDDVAREPKPAALTPFSMAVTTGGEHPSAPAPEKLPPRTLFDDDDNFLAEALQDVAEEAGSTALGAVHERDDDLVAFAPPDDLIARFRDLPPDYLAEQKLTTRVRVTGNADLAEKRLDLARRQSRTAWPDVGYLTPIHPVLDWAADRAITRFERGEVPVVVGDVARPTVLTQAVWSNAAGLAAVGHFGAVTGLPDAPEVGDLLDVIEAAGIKERAINSGGDGVDLAALAALVPPAVDAATAHLRTRRSEFEADLVARADEYRTRLEVWRQAALIRIEDQSGGGRRRDEVERTAADTETLIASLTATGEPFVRVIGVIAPRPGRDD